MRKQVPLFFLCLFPMTGWAQVADSLQNFRLNLNILPAKTASLSWINTTKSQEGYFFLERRTEGGAFETIVTMRVTNKERQYRVTDDKPFPGINHYRIRYLDSTGRSSYSPTVSGDPGLESFCRFYPNPADDHLIVQSTSRSVIQIFSSDGNQILTQTVNRGIVPVNVSLLIRGMYIITFINLDTKASIRNVLYIN
jgi:hypothetical protein